MKDFKKYMIKIFIFNEILKPRLQNLYLQKRQ